jgi:hypothetical protein
MEKTLYAARCEFGPENNRMQGFMLYRLGDGRHGGSYCWYTNDSLKIIEPFQDTEEVGQLIRIIKRNEHYTDVSFDIKGPTQIQSHNRERGLIKLISFSNTEQEAISAAMEQKVPVAA